MKPEQFGAMLADARRKADGELLHSIAMSMASFIAAIDARSIDVAAYRAAARAVDPAAVA